ncbi:nuclear transport factor 2 family protein [Microbacterium lacus]|uniref:nuclear transport factor 2 family protein n=1 Tax=Microbacterium lacus TaxID=415217 RepID=UPI00384AED11
MFQPFHRGVIRLSDSEQITRLIYLYGHVIDDKEWDRLDEIFTDDGEFEIEGTDHHVSGLAAIDRFMRGIVHPLAHFSTNVIVDHDEGSDTARARVKLFAPRANGTCAIATYHDDIARTENGWRFRRRLVKVTELQWRSAPLGSS